MHGRAIPDKNGYPDATAPPYSEEGCPPPYHGQPGAPSAPAAPVYAPGEGENPLREGQSPTGPPPHEKPNWKPSQAQGVGSRGTELPLGSKVTSKKHKGSPWEISGYDHKSERYILKCSRGLRPSVRAKIKDLTPVPKSPGFKAVFKKPLPEGEIWIHLFGNEGMAVSDAKSLVAGNTGLMPEKLVLQMKRDYDGGWRYVRLRDHERLHRNDKVFVKLADNQRYEAESSMNQDAIKVKTPSDGVGCVAGCRQNMHWKSLIFTIIFWSCLFGALYTRFVGLGKSKHNRSHEDSEEIVLKTNETAMKTGKERKQCGFFDTPMDTGNLGLDMALFWAWHNVGLAHMALFFYLISLIEAYCSSTNQYLKNIKAKKGVHRFVNRLQKKAPRIIWNIRCYHMETRTRLVSYKDKDGNRRTRWETYTVRVDTHSASDNYRFDTWDDVSGKLPSLSDYKLTKLTIGKQWMFADTFTAADYNQGKLRFIQLNDRDVSYDFSTTLEIPGYRPKVLAEVKPGSKPEFLTAGWYWFMNILGLGLIFRWYFTAISGQREFNLIKRVQKRVPIMQTRILPTMTVLVPFTYAQVPQQPGMVYNNAAVSLDVRGTSEPPLYT